ncbi:MAG: glucosaminidase domain-containing protein [Acidimicrobiales bacterium]
MVDAKAAVDSAALARLDATAKSKEANLRALVAAGALKDAVAAEERHRRRDAAVAELRVERERLSDLTVRVRLGRRPQPRRSGAAARGRHDRPGLGPRDHVQPGARHPEGGHRAREADLASAKAKLAKAVDAREAAEQEAARRMATATQAAALRAEAERGHLEAITELDQADHRLRTAANRGVTGVPLEVPIIGVPRLTAQDLAGWFANSPYTPRVSTPIEDYARWFIEEGDAEGIRGDIAFAQAVLETGGFANTDSVVGNNFSGIGHYDNVPLGFTFASPHAGVRAQIQLLKAYAVTHPDYANPLVDRRLRGPSGCCQTWGDLTTVWATDPTYGPKVMLLYTSLVDYALRRRARGEGFDDAAATAAG